MKLCHSTFTLALTLYVNQAGHFTLFSRELQHRVTQSDTSEQPEIGVLIFTYHVILLLYNHSYIGRHQIGKSTPALS